VKRVLAILIFAAVAFAQDSPTPPAPLLKVDCAKVDFSPACKSFNEMVDNKDRDLLRVIAGIYHAFVCFRPSEDTFIVISFLPPYDAGFKKSANDKDVSEERGWFTYARYKDGLSDLTRFGRGSWMKAGNLPESFETPQNSRVSVFLDDTELDFGFSYPNAVKTTTEYNLGMRRSTLRFVETYYAKDAKPNKPDYNSTEGGHCAEFLPKSK